MTTRPTGSRTADATPPAGECLVPMPDTRQTTVLIAEDDREMRRLLAEVLRNDGYKVYEVSNGIDLVGFIDRTRAGLRPTLDVVISDVRMPGCTGLEALAALRTVDWEMQFILITAFGSDSVHGEAYRLGAAAVLDKPFHLRELLRTVRSVVPSKV